MNLPSLLRQFLAIAVFAMSSSVFAAAGLKGEDNTKPSRDAVEDQQYGNSYRALGGVYAPQTGNRSNYSNLPETTNSAYHGVAEGGVQERTGEEITVVVSGRTTTLYRMGDRDRSGMGMDTINSPMFYMRQTQEGGGLADMEPIPRLTGESESVYPDHPDWPAPDPNRQISFAQQDCNTCCGGRSFYANGVCFKCEDPNEPPTTIYQCGS